jgi:hypothetical protein
LCALEGEKSRSEWHVLRGVVCDLQHEWDAISRVAETAQQFFFICHISRKGIPLLQQHSTAHKRNVSQNTVYERCSV